LDRVWLTGGFAYEDMTFPSNFRHPPISPGEDHRSQLGPKAALVWELAPQAALRGIYAKSLGGVSLDESYRLEPTQLAGFPQAFRSVISESVVGSVAAPEYQIYGLASDLKFPSRTYVGVQVERLESDVSRTVGVFSTVWDPSIPLLVVPGTSDSTTELLHYRENAFSATVNQLLGDAVDVGLSYKFADVELHDVFPDVPVSAVPTADQTLRSDLRQATGYILFNHPSGFFARADATWYHQHNSGYTPAEPGDDFVQENIYAGYRFLNRRVELLLGVQNLSGQDYHLNPLTTYMELPRERSYIARLKFQF
jgi:hypothetical protein